MGREIRRVPPNWQHPKREVPNYRMQRMEEDYQPMRDVDVEEAWEGWLERFAEWKAGKWSKMAAEYPESNYSPTYRSFCEWDGEPPDPKYYRPAWTEEPTWYQMYETVSEGTPVSPPFATPEELVDYLVANGDFWDQKRGHGGWKRENAEAFVKTGFAVSMATVGGKIYEPRDGVPA